MRIFRSRLICLGVMAAAALAVPQGAAAADAGAQAGGPRVIQEVIVTARKREESVQDVPIAITALSEELNNSNIRGLADLNGYAPNVRIDEDPGRANGVSINIRGISPTRIDDNSLDAPIGVVIDGIYLGSLAGQALENFDLQRIEILRGPQGTLFGRNTVGGVLNVVRSRPTGEWGMRAKITAGQNNQRELRAVVNAPILEDTLAIKGFYTSLRDDGYLRNTFLGRKQPQKDYENYGFVLLANPTDEFEALLTIEKFDDNTEGGANLTNYNLAAGVADKPPVGSPQVDISGGFLACGLYGLTDSLGFTNGISVPCRTSLKEPSTISTDVSNPAALSTVAYSLTMSYALTDDVSLVSVSGYRDMTENRLLDFDGTSANHITIDRDNDYKQFSQELRVEGTWNDVTFVGGVYYWNSEFTQDWVTGGKFWEGVSNLSGYSLAKNTWRPVPFLAGNAGVAAAIADGLTPIQACLAKRLGAVRCDSAATAAGLGDLLVQKLFETQETSATAYFASVDWKFLEDWTLTAGIRYTDEKKEFKAGQSYLATIARQHVDNFPEFADLDNDWQETSPRIGISYQFNDDINFYATYSEGFHSGGFFGVNQNTRDFVRDQYDPEFAFSYEIGMKGQFLDNILQVNAALFRNNFKDKQESAVQFDGTTNTVATVFSNVADARYQGAELEVQLVAGEYLNFFGSFGYLDAEYENFQTDINPNDDATVGAKLEDASFLKPRNAPEYTFGFGGTGTLPLGPDGGELSLTVKYSWIDEIEASLLNLEVGHIDSRKDVAATLSYTYKDYVLSIYGRNLTDEQIEFPALIVPLFAAGTLTQGRSWGVELSAQF